VGQILGRFATLGGQSPERSARPIAGIKDLEAHLAYDSPSFMRSHR
jgi:hypothetical protein